ncbi:hypothetical protein L7F22_055111 [Adiantum nelumboides]|nr:hypothetical protein [Adiantum nelumboides]
MGEMTSFQYATVVDALLVDIRGIDKFSLKSIHMFLSPQKVDLYSKDGVSCSEVARLIFADFPNGLLVDALQTTFEESMTVPKWNLYSKELIIGTMDLANKFLADEGFLVTECLAQHIGELFVDALRIGLSLHRTWTLMCANHGYRHPITREVQDLTICLWYHAGKHVRSYDRDVGAMVDNVHFPAMRSYVLDCKVTPLEV